MTIIVYGPAGCGKTHNAQAIAAMFRCNAIVDEFDPQLHRIAPGALHLTQFPPASGRTAGARVFSFDSLPKNLTPPDRKIPNRAPRFAHRRD